MCKREDPEVYEKMIKRVMGKDFTSRQYATEIVDELLEYQDKRPPKDSPWPDMERGWHKRGLPGQKETHIYNKDGTFICHVGEGAESVLPLLLAAPDLRDLLYEVAAKPMSITLTDRVHAALRKAGVSI